MSANEHLRDQQIQHAIHVLGYSNSLQNEMLGFLNDLEQDVVSKLGARLAVAQAKGRDPGPKTTQRIEDTIEEIRSLTENVYSKAHDHLRDNLIPFAQAEAEHANKAINAATKSKLSNKLPAPTLLKAIVEDRSHDGQLLKPWTDKMGAATSDRVARQIRLGYANGEGVDKIVARVTGTEGFQGSQNSARAMVRTTVNSIANQAQQETWKANSDLIEGWQFVATLDSRTTLICSSLDGQVFPLGEGPIPPRHPQCRSITIAVLRAANKVKAPMSAATRASMDGQVAAPTTMERFLKTKGEDFQNTIMGPTRADLWRRGKLNLNDFIRNYSEVIPLDDLRRLHPEAFGGAAAKAETVEAIVTGGKLDIDAVDAEAKSYVMRMGEKTGNEHLVCYDRQTGETIETKEGDRSSVTFTLKLVAALKDKRNSIVLHHNHPRSSSLSLPDMHVITSNPGAAGIWAHGHNGSSFYAERGKFKFSKATVNALYDTIHGKLQALVTAGIVTVADACLLDNHLLWLALNRVGQISYRATLAGESLAAYDRNRILYERILEALNDN